MEFCKVFYSINRIRLEFKGSTTTTCASVYPVLIESDWNLKYFKNRKSSQGVKVLIESDWNLKRKMQRLQRRPQLVLIESDWNLK